MCARSINPDEEYFDIESLPDIGSDNDLKDRFVDIINTEKKDEAFEKKELMDLSRTDEQYTPTDPVQFREPAVERSGNTITIRFKISKQEIAQVQKLTGGILSQEFTEGMYIFSIRHNEVDGEDLYYGDTLVGEFINNYPRVYKRFFFTAATLKMCQDGLLFEYAPLKFTIHPKLYGHLVVSNPDMARELSKKGLPLFTEEEMQAIIAERKASE